MSLNPKPLDVPDVINMVYPIGSIYETEDSEFNPNVLWGGTWERIKGRVLVGVDENDADFDTSGKTGGEKTHILTTSELASHNHSFTGTAVTSGKGSEHTHTFTGTDVTSGGQS